MADPLSITTGVLGFMSFGIEVAQSLYKYYTAVKSQPSNIQHTLLKLQQLEALLEQLRSHIEERQSRPGGVELVKTIKPFVEECEDCTQELKEEADKSGAPPDPSLLECLHQIFRMFEDVYIIIDALDESPRDYHRGDMLETLSEMRAWLDCSLHLLVTSRDEPDIKDELQTASEDMVHLKNDDIDKDIALFVTEHLERNRRLRKWMPYFAETESVLVQKAGGVFRSVECQFKELMSCPQSKALLDLLLGSLPRALEETYDRMIRNIPSGLREYARQMLTILCYVTRPLSVAELIDAIAVDLHEGATPSFQLERRLFDVTALQEVCPGFIETDLQEKMKTFTVRLAHFSVQEYLESGRSNDIEATAFIIRRANGQAIMASICLTFLLDPRLSMLEIDGIHQSFRLLNMLHVIRLFINDHKSFEIWTEIWKPEYSDATEWEEQGNVPTALYCASFAWDPGRFEAWCQMEPNDSTLKALDVGFRDALNAQCGRLRKTPLQAVAACGHLDVVRILLRKGANPNVKSAKGADKNIKSAKEREAGSPLIAAAKGSYNDIVDLLLQNGAEINATSADGSRGHAVCEAARRGEYTTVQLLLKRGAEANFDTHHETPLRAASGSGEVEVVKLLISAGARDVDAALDVAVKCNKSESLRYLGKNTRHKYSDTHRQRDKRKLLASYIVDSDDNSLKTRGYDDKFLEAAIGINGYRNCLEAAVGINNNYLVDLLLSKESTVGDGKSRKATWREAAKEGYESVLLLLLEKSTNVNYQKLGQDDCRYATCALAWAVTRSHKRVVQLLIEKGASIYGCYDICNDHKAKGRQWHLYEAASLGHVEIVRLIIENGATLDGPNAYYLPQGIGVNASSTNFSDASSRIPRPSTATEVALSALEIASLGGHKDIVELLLEKLGGVARVNECIYNASIRGHVEIVKLLLASGVDPAISSRENINGVTALDAASAGGHAQIVRILLDQGMDVNAKDSSNMTALLRASRGGHREVVKFLLQHGADPPLTVRTIMTLRQASSQGCKDIVELLLAKGACLSVNELGALSDAAAYGSKGIVQMLLLNGFDEAVTTNLLHEDCRGALHRVLSYTISSKIAQLLLENGADGNAPIHGYTALELAAAAGHLDAVIVLLNQFDKLNVRCERAMDVVYLAINQKVTYPSRVDCSEMASQEPSKMTPRECLRLVLRVGVDTSPSYYRRRIGTTLLRRATSDGRKDAVILLLEDGAEVNAQFEEGETPLEIASRNGRRDIVSMLLTKGADPNVHYGESSALEEACAQGGNGDLVDLLLKNGADVNAESEKCNGTALQAALIWRQERVADLLLKVTTNVNEKGTYKSALQLAVSHGYATMTKTLLEKGIDPNAHEHRGGWIPIKTSDEHRYSRDYRYWPGPASSSVEHLEGLDSEMRFKPEKNPAWRRIWTPLHEAIVQGHEAIVKLLLDHGADKSLCHAEYENALEAAIDHGRDGLVGQVSQDTTNVVG
ncbi:hypothetical protein CSAL01_02126 [Colletotrichum salicis]|uniref:Uncharacterized protein n=1 Tax=Colletotrichum salicis TaxID=1209931 RepID=A0A135V011_9PEZI|nr:hypothetical protein CSAL01_02126 [Colletotrichum salicis]